jgi:hypothetical protein
MSVTASTPATGVPEQRKAEILARIDRGGLHICEAELHHQLRWNEREDGSLLDALAELEALGLTESALHFRLTARGRAQLPQDHQPPIRYGSGIPWSAVR